MARSFDAMEFIKDNNRSYNEVLQRRLSERDDDERQPRQEQQAKQEEPPQPKEEQPAMPPGAQRGAIPLVGSGASMGALPDRTGGNGGQVQVGGGGHASGGSISTAMNAAMHQLRMEGVPDANLRAAAAHLTGQAIMESSLNPAAVHDNHTGYGIYGARLGRRDSMFGWLNQNGYDRNSLEGQMRYMAHEAMSDPNYRATRNTLMNASPDTLRSSVRGITKNFEGPAVINDRSGAVQRAFDHGGTGEIGGPAKNTAKPAWYNPQQRADAGGVRVAANDGTMNDASSSASQRFPGAETKTRYTAPDMGSPSAANGQAAPPRPLIENQNRNTVPGGSRPMQGALPAPMVDSHRPNTVPGGSKPMPSALPTNPMDGGRPAPTQASAPMPPHRPSQGDLTGEVNSGAPMPPHRPSQGELEGHPTASPDMDWSKATQAGYSPDVQKMMDNPNDYHNWGTDEQMRQLQGQQSAGAGWQNQEPWKSDPIGGFFDDMFGGGGETAATASAGADAGGGDFGGGFIDDIANTLGGIGDSIGGFLGFSEGGLVPDNDADEMGGPNDFDADDAGGAAQSGGASLADALAAGLDGVEEGYGLRDQQSALPTDSSSSPDTLNALNSNANAVSPEAMGALIAKVSNGGTTPDPVGEAVRQIYDFYASKGDMETAKMAASGVLQAARQQSMELGQDAMEALQARDYRTATSKLIAAYNQVPDGRQVQGQVNEAGMGTADVTDVASGEVVQQIQLTPQFIQMAADSFAKGKDFYGQIASVATPKAKPDQQNQLA